MLQQEWQAFKDKVREEGREEGQRLLVQRQLETKSGDLDDATIARLGASDLATLQRYSKCLLTAATLDEVFAE